MTERIVTAVAPGVHGESSGNGERPDGHTIPPPRADEKMFRGLVGSVAEMGAEGSEVSPVAPGMAFLSWLSAQIGRDAYIQIGNVRHPIVINVLHVGRSMRAAKSESIALLLRTESAIWDGLDCGSEALLGQRRRGRVSALQDIALLVHDGYQDIPPIDDKRLWLYELPFAPLLRRMKGGGDAVSEGLSDICDGGSIRMVAKTGSLSATSPHIAVHATITSAEFQSMLDQSVIHQGHGLASRFLIFWAERIDTVPVPVPTDAKTITSLAKALRAVVAFARGQYPRTRYSRAVQLSPEARELYETFYSSLRGLDSWGGIGTGLLQRLAPITMRIASVYALADISLVIRPEHMEAALACAAYHRDSVRYVLAGEADQHQRAGDLADRQAKVLAALRESGGWLSRTDIVRQVFRNHVLREDLTAVLESLLADGAIEQRREPNANNPGQKTLYRIAGAKRGEAGTEGQA